MKKFILSVLLIALSAQFVYAQKTKVIEWKFGHNANTDHIWHLTALKFAELVEEKSGGKMKVKVFPNGQLGKETDMINGVRMGTLDIVLTGETLANWAPKAALMAVPYAINDFNHMEKVVNGPVGLEIKDDIIKKAGLLPLYYHERAPRNLTTNKVIKSVNDLKGLRIRVPDVPVFVKTWEQLGAKPTPMALQEVFTSLQQNIIQAQENPIDLIYSLGFYEIQKYIYETEHVYQWIYATVGVKQFNKLSKELQSVVIDSAVEAEKFAANKFKNFTVEMRKNIQSKGMEIVPVNKEEYKNKVIPALQQILTAEQYRLYQEIQKIK